VEHVAEHQGKKNRGLLRDVLDEVTQSSKISQFLNSMIAADVRRPSHRPHSATRTRSKFAFLWPRSG
jgi:hypothetical protein